MGHLYPMLVLVSVFTLLVEILLLTLPPATFSVPTTTTDAQRTEALGPMLAALIVATMEG